MMEGGKALTHHLTKAAKYVTASS